MDTKFVVPTAADYAQALQELKLTDYEKAMLRAHYLAHNRTITCTDLAKAAGYKDYGGANLHYGFLGRRIGEALHVNFILAPQRDAPFYSSAIGMGNPYAPQGSDFQFVMHHELAKAIEQLGWFGTG